MTTIKIRSTYGCEQCAKEVLIHWAQHMCKPKNEYAHKIETVARGKFLMADPKRRGAER